MNNATLPSFSLECTHQIFLFFPLKSYLLFIHNKLSQVTVKYTWLIIQGMALSSVRHRWYQYPSILQQIVLQLVDRHYGSLSLPMPYQPLTSWSSGAPHRLNLTPIMIARLLSARFKASVHKIKLGSWKEFQWSR